MNGNVKPLFTLETSQKTIMFLLVSSFIAGILMFVMIITNRDLVWFGVDLIAWSRQHPLRVPALTVFVFWKITSRYVYGNMAHKKDGPRLPEIVVIRPVRPSQYPIAIAQIFSEIIAHIMPVILPLEMFAEMFQFIKR